MTVSQDVNNAAIVRLRPARRFSIDDGVLPLPPRGERVGERGWFPAAVT
ncbi:hypothetical protein B551_0207970 [Cupriavidus sp. HPC(L)]|nr:hypothetical protein B551_0207970 [Cupriavidus sp. HPC(L)]